MADLALSNVSNRNVESLTQSEHRRVAIGVQLVRDPVVLLLDEPTADLDPLNTYFVISILANHAKKYNRIVLLTMEKPRLGRRKCHMERSIKAETARVPSYFYMTSCL